MSKKRFSEGLDDLFKDIQSEPVSGPVERTPAQERKSAHKNFMSGLDSLLQEAMEVSLEKYESKQTNSSSSNSKTKSDDSVAARANLTGLDALIRQTIDVKEIMSDENSGKKRLTVAVDRSKLDKLKLIARLENSYLKDLLIGVIDSYIEEYTQQKGVDL